MIRAADVVHSERIARLVIFTVSIGTFAGGMHHLRAFPFIRFLDPVYPYLYNGVVVVQRGTPGHTDHPGTSLQWLAGLVSWLVHLFRFESSDLARDVVANSTLYLQANGVVLLLAFSLSLTFLGLRTLNQLGATPTLALMSGFSACLRIWYPQVFLLSPESVVLTTTVLVLALMIPCIASTANRLSKSELVLVGLAFAVGTTSKIIMLPLAILFPFLLKPRQVLLIAVTFLATVAVILTPVYSQIGRMRGWFLGIATRPTRYGSSSTDWQVLENMRSALTALGEAVSLYSISIIASIAIALGLLLLRGTSATQSQSRSKWRSTIGLLTAIVFTYGMSYKPSVERDFVTLTVLVPLFTALTTKVALDLMSKEYQALVWKWLKSGILTIITLGFIQFPISLHAATHDIEDWKTSYAQVAEKLMANESIGWVAHAYGSPGISHASFFGNAWANELFEVELAEQFPRKLELDIWGKSIYGWDSDFRWSELNCEDLNARLDSSKVFVAIYQNQLNTYWPSRDDGLSTDVGTLTVVDEEATGYYDLLLLEIGNCI